MSQQDGGGTCGSNEQTAPLRLQALQGERLREKQRRKEENEVAFDVDCPPKDVIYGLKGNKVGVNKTEAAEASQATLAERSSSSYPLFLGIDIENDAEVSAFKSLLLSFGDQFYHEFQSPPPVPMDKNSACARDPNETAQSALAKLKKNLREFFG